MKLRTVVFFLFFLIANFALASSVPVQKFTVSVSAREIVAATLILEAGGEGQIGMEAVREVINNRAGKNKTEISVCLARKQFSCWNNITPERGIYIAKKHPKWNLALSIVNGRTNHTKGATHYHAHSVSPSWAKKLHKTVTIKNHTFYK